MKMSRGGQGSAAEIRNGAERKMVIWVQPLCNAELGSQGVGSSGWQWGGQRAERRAHLTVPLLSTMHKLYK